jgi:AraC family transcriptional regulator of adaptative response / DNA-3-methyladenine glycosylase II
MHLDREPCYRALLTRDARFDGRFFVAVRTTGVYCRPICPARPPKLEHIVFMPTAAAAQEAGFRPCLRCRPERSPELAPWHGTPSTVSRAMALIEAGALNDDNMDALADRLGLGDRQLRRLFRQHIGASPKAVAQTRRVLLAKQLITDTKLPLTQVAFASGFGSLRRFNDTFRKLYGRPPRHLRQASTHAVAAAEAITLTLPFKPPYDWSTIVRFLAARAIPGVEDVNEDRYARTIALGEAQGTIVVRRAAPREGANSLVATIRFPVIAALPAIINRIRCIFDLGADPAAIGAHLADDPTLARLVAARPGLRAPGAWDGFELAVRAILGQQISVGAASQLAGKLVVAHGTPLQPPEDSIERALRFVFPAPDRLVSADLARALGIPRARAGAISSLAAAAVANPALFEPSQSLEDAVARLTALPGIGEWTAQYIAMRALREPDAFPASDIGLMRALATSDRRPTPSEVLARATAWRPWRAYAALYLWTADTATSAAHKEKRREVVA